MIVACAKKSGGDLRLVEKASECSSSERAVTWSASGGQGPVGARGLAGAAGPAGNTTHRPGVHNGVVTACFEPPTKGNRATSGDLNVLVCLKGARKISWNIRGPRGLRGLPGAAGARGAQGPAGAAGAQGAQGPVGPAGAQGPAGAAGAQGAQGPAGPAGTAATGPEGPAGAQGPAGAAGAQGAQGPAGPAGTAGATGPAGPATEPKWRYVFTTASVPSGTGRTPVPTATCPAAAGVPQAVNGGGRFDVSGNPPIATSPDVQAGGLTAARSDRRVQQRRAVRPLGSHRLGALREWYGRIVASLSIGS